MIASLSAMMNLNPNLTFILDVSEDTAKKRLLARGEHADRYERLDAFFHARVNAGFREIAAQSPERCVLIPADSSESAVHGAIMATLRTRLGLGA
jgi:dTMP kinase